MPLRPYQTALLDRVRAEWRDGAANVMMQLHTGGGKTVILGEEVRERNARGEPSAVLAHRNELVWQLSVALARERVYHNIVAADKVKRLVIEEHCAATGTSYYDPTAPCAVLSVDTAVNRLDALREWGATVRLHVPDEAHHVLRGNKWGSVITQLFTHPDCQGLMPTATPERADKKGLGAWAHGIANRLVEGPSGAWLMEQGYLSRYRVAAVDSHIREYLSRVGPSGDYTRANMREAFRKSEIAGDIARTYKELADGKIGITFAPGIEEAQTIVDSYTNASIPCRLLIGDTPMAERREIWASLVARQILQVVAVDVISEGVDVPAVEVLTLARPSESLALVLQQIGRGLRPAPGKEFLQIIDHVGNFLNHRGGPDTPRQWSLDAPVKRRKSGSDVPIVICPNTTCGLTFERFRKCCPFCGHALPPPVQRAGPEFVDGVVRMLDDETLARLRGETVDVDLALGEYSWQLGQKNVPPIGIAGMVKKMAAKQEAQRHLRAAMELWGGVQKAEGLADDEMQAKFYLTFGVDVLTARTLGIEDARNLTEAVVRSVPFERAPPGAWMLGAA